LFYKDKYFPMPHTELKIKNMVCPRCIKVVRDEIEKLGHKIEDIKLGEAKIHGELSEKQRLNIRKSLEENGFELIDDHKSQVIEALKTLIINKIHHGNYGSETVVWSDLISKELDTEYKYLSQLFSSVEGITIEHYIILQKIEKAKELIVYDELTLSEIAWKLNYSSVAHLSSQFKKITGMSPKNFKNIGTNKRKSIDKV